MSEKYGGREKEEKEVQLVPRLLRHWLIGRLLVTGLAVGCYANSCWGEFVFDDSEAVVGNEDVDPEASSWREVFSHDFWGENISSRTSHKSYRPLTVFSFRFNFWMAGGIRDPFYYHLTNVLLHPLVCLLLLEVFSKWFRQLKTIYKSSCELEGVPFVASLLFAVHPLHTETVSDDLFLFSANFFHRKLFNTGVWSCRKSRAWLGNPFPLFNPAIPIFDRPSE